MHVSLPFSGRLALTLDMLTDALVLVGQHGVYCQSARQPGKPAMDIQIISQQISAAKELVLAVMDFRARFTVERMVEETNAVYERLAGTRRATDTGRRAARG